MKDNSRVKRSVLAYKGNLILSVGLVKLASHSSAVHDLFFIGYEEAVCGILFGHIPRQDLLGEFDLPHVVEVPVHIYQRPSDSEIGGRDRIFTFIKRRTCARKTPYIGKISSVGL